MNDANQMRRLAVLALVAAAGNNGLNLPGLISGLRLMRPEGIQSCLNELQRKKLVRRGTSRSKDGDHDVVCYFVDHELELAVNV